MSNIYAQIQSGTVINVIVAEPSDFFNPNYIWIDITNLSVVPSVGWTYDGTNFISDIPSITLSQAIAANLSSFQIAMVFFISQKYSLDTRFNLLAIYENARLAGNLPNRMNYIAQLLAWDTSVITYAGMYCMEVKALTDPAVVAATVWDFTQIGLPDPMITPINALAISN